MQDDFYNKEACVGSLQECLEAEKRGATRIEFCIRLDVGGLTPSYQDILDAKQQLKIPFTVMIRNREGNFTYTKEELEEMKQQILFCKQNQIYGVVFGILHQDKTVDIETTKQLVELSKPMEVVFHKAFDETIDPYKALEDVISTGCNMILTSGTKSTALEGKEILAKIVEQAKNRIKIMPGGGVTKDNLQDLRKTVKTTDYHGTKIV